MTTAVLSSPHNVQTTLNYYAALGEEAPFSYAFDPPGGGPRSNIGTDAKPAEIYDIRGREGTVSMDTTGFTFVKHTSQEKDFVDDEKIKDVYYKEVEELLKGETGAKRIFIFDHTIRRALEDSRDLGTDGQPMRGPGTRVHVDQTYQAGFDRVTYHLPDESERLLKGRVRIINVWRPIENPVEHHPLAVGDWRTVDPENDLVPTRLVYTYREGSNYSVRYNPNHKFYYLSHQTPEEVILIKCFDSDTSKARLTPHTAFLDPNSPKDAPHRQSIEVRALVFDLE